MKLIKARSRRAPAPAGEPALESEGGSSALERSIRRPPGQQRAAQADRVLESHLGVEAGVQVEAEHQELGAVGLGARADGDGCFAAGRLRFSR